MGEHNAPAWEPERPSSVASGELERAEVAAPERTDQTRAGVERHAEVDRGPREVRVDLAERDHCTDPLAQALDDLAGPAASSEDDGLAERSRSARVQASNRAVSSAMHSHMTSV